MGADHMAAAAIEQGGCVGVNPDLGVDQAGIIGARFFHDCDGNATVRHAQPEIVEKNTARELFDYVLNEGRKEYIVQRYKGLGEMTAEQLWETTMDPERRTLLQVRLEDIAECETIFTTLMGEDVEARRKFIEDNALDVKNLDI